MQEYLKELTENSNLKRKEYGDVMSTETNENGPEQLLKFSLSVALQRYSDKTMNTSSTVAAYLTYPCVKTELQVRLAWCLKVIKRSEYQDSKDSRSKGAGVGTNGSPASIDQQRRLCDSVG